MILITFSKLFVTSGEKQIYNDQELVLHDLHPANYFGQHQY